MEQQGRSYPLLIIVILAMLSSTWTDAAVSGSQAIPTISIHRYISDLERVIDSGGANNSTHLDELRRHHRYYRQVAERINGSLHVGSGAVADCIPFLDQPPLINAAEDFRRNAVQIWHDRQMAEKFTSMSSCPQGHVEIVRPHLKQTNDQAPKRHKGHPSHLKAGYYYVVSPNKETKGDLRADVVLGVGHEAKAPLPLCPHNLEVHTLNQLWWSNNWGGPKMATLEAGWIMSEYFTSEPRMVLFTFSTPDDYGPSKYNQYNTAGDFVMYPGGHALGKPLDNFLFLVQYVELPAAKGFELRLRRFHPAKRNGSNLESEAIGEEEDEEFEFGEWNAVGYYPMHRFEGAIKMHILQVGAEVYVADRRESIHAGGKLFGWGTRNYGGLQALVLGSTETTSSTGTVPPTGPDTKMVSTGSLLNSLEMVEQFSMGIHSGLELPFGTGTGKHFQHGKLLKFYSNSVSRL